MRSIIVLASTLVAAVAWSQSVTAPSSAPAAPYSNASAAPQFSNTAPPPASTGPERQVPVPLSGTSQIGPGANVLGLAPVYGGDLLSWGLLHLHPHLVYRLSYGDSLQPAYGERVNSFINEFSPGLMLNLGEHWTLDYTPTLRWYSDDRFTDGVDHSVSLSWHTQYEDWNFGFSQGYSLTTQPLIETGAQTDQESFSTGLNASYAFNSKISLDMGLRQDFRYTGGGQANSSLDPYLTDTREWSTMEWLNYQYAPPLTVAVGAGVTYDDIGTGSNMISEQLQARISWHPGIRLTLTATGGADIRQFLDSDLSGTVTPIWSLTANYKLYENTSLFLTGGQSVAPSYFGNTLTTSTSLSAGLNQRLLGHLNFSISGGYSMNDYSGTTPAGPPSALIQSYDSTFLGVSLGTTFLRRINASIFYNKSFNTSASPLYDYSPSTVGLELSAAF